MRAAIFCVGAAWGALGFTCDSPHSGLDVRRAAAAVEQDTQVTLTSEADVDKRRAELIRFIWGSGGLPKGLPKVNKDVRTISQCSDADLQASTCTEQSTKQAQAITGPQRLGALRNLKRVDDFLFSMDAGERSIAHHFTAKESNNRLVILHQGHWCTLDGRYLVGEADYGGLIHLMDELLVRGFSVLAMYMPHYQPDLCDIILHDVLFQGSTVTEGNIVKVFVEPIVVSLNYLRTKSASDDFPSYATVDMVGLSGGGWTTTFYTAIDPSIERGLDMAGSVPLSMARCSSGKFPNCATRPGGNGYNGYEGDGEQAYTSIYQAAGGYLDLYTMGATGRPGGLPRQRVWLLNRVDENPAGPGPFTQEQYEKNVQDFAKLVQEAVKKTNGGSFKSIIDTIAPHHMISPWATAKVILPALERLAEPADASIADGPRADGASGSGKDVGGGDEAAAHAGLVDAGEGQGGRSPAGTGGGCSCALARPPRTDGTTTGWLVGGLVLAIAVARARHRTGRA